MSTSSGTSEDILFGYVEHRRPMLRLYFFDIGKHVDTLVDTGFTMELLVDDIDFVARTGFKSKNVVRSGTLASGVTQSFIVWETEIE